MALRLILVFLLIGTVHGRILKLNSSDDNNLTSDGFDHFDNQTSYYGLNACNHQYGFLPCAENVAGFVFQIFVYQGLLIYGEKLIGGGSKVLFNIIGVGKIGGIIFRILMSLPSMILMIFSGVFSSTETAQSLVSVGVGIYAGITVFSLTLQWTICVLYGRRDLSESRTVEHNAGSQSDCLMTARKTIIVLKDTGVELDEHTKYTAGIMLLSLIPYIIVQLDIFSTSPNEARLVTFIALIVSSLFLMLYFGYQIWYPWIQERSLDYSKYENLRKEFLEHIQKHGDLVDENGEINTGFILKLFNDADTNNDEFVTSGEMEELVVEMIRTGKIAVDKRFAVEEIMKSFDQNGDKRITLEEFINGCVKWIGEMKDQPESSDSSSTSISHELLNLFKKRKETDEQERDRIMAKLLKHAETELLKAKSLVTRDGKPNIKRIKNLFTQFDSNGDTTISKHELEQLLKTINFGESQINYDDVVRDLFKDFDKDNNNVIDEPEFIEGMKRIVKKAIRVSNTSDKSKVIDKFHEKVWAKKYQKRDLLLVVLQISFGVILLTFLGGPLVVSILQLSFAMNLPSFSISFVIVPLALNARTTLATILPSSRKSQRTDSLTFSEIYGGVIMNNIAGMTTLLAIIYVKDLKWEFSAEVLTIMVVCSIIGGFAYSCKSYPTWTCIVAILLYPLSLGLFYVAQSFWSWK